MSKSVRNSADSIWFISHREYHRPRLRRSTYLLGIGIALSSLGYYLISSDLPDMSSRRPQVIAQWTPMVVGLATLIFGTIGAATAFSGLRRSSSQAIDLDFGENGITVRGAHFIPWTEIRAVTSVEYHNDAKLKLLWDDSDLQRSLLVEVNDGADVPHRKIIDGKPCIKIDLLRYPAAEYSKRYEAALAQFTRHRIPVEHKKKWKQT
ncbi:hypothetical protein [Glutamicibacter sp.]|uniref:hypothetical protein n=1 Tax=Glutamicibacter sp. TaxID=1931995 RepID=UPI0028BD5C71|nr:hypothetical protein [Glutamicibacter sp.]